MTSRFALLRSTLALSIAATATVAIVAGSAAPVNAAETPSIAISTQGIDLLSPAGAARIEAQIGRAARAVCTPADNRSPAAALERIRCIETAMANAMPQLATLAANARDARMAVADAAPAAPSVGIVRR